MPCEVVAPGVMVLRQPYVRAVAHCVTCGCKRPMAGTFGIYYGSRLICFGCGDLWDSEGGGPDPRPGGPGWREKRLELARRMWQDAPTLKQTERRQMAAETAEDNESET